MFKKVTVTAMTVAAVFMAMPIMAQTVTTDDTLGSLSSNTKTSTAAIFNNDVDNFINYHNYSNVLTDGAKWFGFITGRNHAQVNGLLDAGYAISLGSLYLGIWYRGNVVQKDAQTKTHSINPTWDNNREILLQTVETTAYSGNQWLSSSNQIEFLIGVAGQGIKVGFFESYASDQNTGLYNRNITITDYQDGRKDFTNAIIAYENKQGYLKPYLGWGSNFAIGEMNLMPYVDLGLTIYNNTLVDNYESYTEINGAKQNVLGTVGAGHNNGYLQPYGAVGIKLDLAKKDTVRTQIELKYNIDMRFYENDYSASGLSGGVSGTAGWGGANQYIDRVTNYADRTETATNITLTINEQTRINHLITPTYKITGEPLDGFRLGFSANIPITIRSESNSGYTDRYEITKADYAADKMRNTETTTKTLTHLSANQEVSTFIIGLNLNLGASYKLIPDRFSVNLGIAATPLNYTSAITKRTPTNVDSIATTTTKDAAGNVTESKTVTPASGDRNNDTVVVNDSWDQWTATLYGGFVFNFNSKAALDFGVSSGIGSTNDFNLNLTTVNLIFMLKF